PIVLVPCLFFHDVGDHRGRHSFPTRRSSDLEVHTYAEQCPIGGGVIHLGATSMDIEDNADALRIRDSLDLILDRMRSLLETLSEQIERLADRPTMAFTHIQPAEPTTLGYRLP